MLSKERRSKHTVHTLDRASQRKPAIEKDNEEVQLEKLVFGDDEGFNQALRTYDVEDSDGGDISDDSVDRGIDASEPEEEEEEEGELDEVADDELFFIDAGIPKGEASALVLAAEEDNGDDTDAPAWIDSEDEKIVVSLASNTRLRKLRRTEAEDLVHGREYIKRLQQQFERLYPRPAWAVQAETGTRRKKKRRRASFQDGSGDEIDSDDSMDLDALDGQPLSRLLRSTDLLTEAPSSDSSRRMLRAGILDIQRSKDIGDTQPVRRILPGLQKPC